MLTPLNAKPRAAFFVDGSNFYHACVHPGAIAGGLLRDVDYYDIDFMALARNLAGPARQVVGVRYYVGRLKEEGNLALYARQRAFFADLRRDGVVCCPGRMVKRPMKDKAAAALEALLRREDSRGGLPPGLRCELEELRRPTADALGAWLGGLQRRRVWVDPPLYAELRGIQKTWRGNTEWQEKAVDVKIAVDMLAMAHRDEYDHAYLLSFDGDYTPVAEEVRTTGRKVFAVCPAYCNSSAIRRSVNQLIRLDRNSFNGAWRKRRGKQ